MKPYSLAAETQMKRFYDSLNERDRRRYCAIEVIKLKHGAMTYISGLLNCDPKTISKGIGELESDQELVNERQRKKGRDEKMPS